jgi:phage gpG-like protein
MQAKVYVSGLDETLRDLQAIVDNAEDMSVIHTDIAMTVRNWQTEHFDKAEDSRGSMWKPLSPLTRALRGQANGNPKPLQDTGRLKASVQVMRSGPEGWMVGTRKKQAAVHQYGATITPKRGQFLFIPLNMRGEGKRAKRRNTTQHLRLRSATIPAREFLYLNPREREEMVNIYASEVASRNTFYIRWTRMFRTWTGAQA